ncbi:MAG: sigma-54 dependent transcriptional regulator [Hyphomicrobiaceae bacterium]
MKAARHSKRVLVIEDDRTLNRLLVEQMRRMGHFTTSAHTWVEAKAALHAGDPSLVMLDMKLPDAEGSACLPELTTHCPVIVLTASGSIKQAVESMRAGAAEYLVKPVNPSELELAVNRVLETSSLKRSFDYYRDQLNPSLTQLMVGRSPAFLEMVRLIELVAPSNSTILIEGESGVGKELVAKSIHLLSQRAKSNFVAIDATTLQDTLFESELFGHERGAFTGAERRKDGLIEVAEGGTVFLDEIGELPAGMQAKLLRVLETGEFRRVGGVQSLSSDVRFVAATNRNLLGLIDDARFRSDLYYRLATVLINVPPLRHRREDIALIADRFLETRSFQRAKMKRLGKDAIDLLTSYAWPGNIRELRNVIERAILVSGDAPVIHAGHIMLQGTPGAGADQSVLSFDHEPTLEEIRRRYIGDLVVKYNGHRSRIAEVLGISERNTYRLLKKYALADE